MFLPCTYSTRIKNSFHSFTLKATWFSQSTFWHVLSCYVSYIPYNTVNCELLNIPAQVRMQAQPWSGTHGADQVKGLAQGPNCALWPFWENIEHPHRCMKPTLYWAIVVIHYITNVWYAYIVGKLNHAFLSYSGSEDRRENKDSNDNYFHAQDKLIFLIKWCFVGSFETLLFKMAVISKNTELKKWSFFTLKSH